MPKALTKEEQARVHEEEEKRLRQEQEAAARAADKLAELKRKHEMEIEELKFRISELDETRELLSRHRKALEKMRLERVGDYVWYRYLVCDGLPNPIIEKELNTYTSLWRMDERRISMEEVMVDSVNAMKLIGELQTLIADLDESYSELERYRAVMQDLRELVEEKVNRACVETLTKAAHFADPETANLQKHWRNNWISLCIWGNLSKNPRIKRYTFEETGITFSIPHLLTISDCAFRIVFMKFDTYSVTSLSYKPRAYTSSENKLSSLSTFDTIPSLNGQELTAEAIDRLMHGTKSDGELENTKVVGDETSEDVAKEATRATVGLFDVINEDAKDMDMEQEEREEKVELPEEDRVETPTKPLWMPVALPEDAIDLCDYHVVGGVFHFDLLKLPRQPRTGRGWRWTNCVVPPVLAPLEYVVDGVPTGAGKGGVKEGNEGAEEEEAADREVNSGPNNSRDELHQPNPPVAVTLRLPDCLIIPEEPVLACWDAENLIWRSNGIMINSFAPSLNEISFITAVFGTFAVFQDFHLNMPFQHWEMRPLPRKVVKGRRNKRDADQLSSLNEYTQDLSSNTRDTPETTVVGDTQPQPIQSTTEAEKASQKSTTAGQTVATPAPHLGQAAAEMGEATGAQTVPATGVPTQPTQINAAAEAAATAALGPLDSMGLPDSVFLADKTEADQCLITITGAYIRVNLHVLDDRVAIVVEDPRAILDPIKMAEEEEAAAAAKTRGGVDDSGAGVDEGASTVAGGGGRRGGGNSMAAPRLSRVNSRPAPSAEDANSAVGVDGGDSRVPLELEHLTGRWFTPEELVNVLMASGVNIFPRADSCTRVECVDKNPLTEQRLYEQMALLSPVMAFGWSHWNAACQDPESIILVAAEHIENDELVDEERWKVYSMDRRYVYQLRISEATEKFNADPEPSLHRHADFYHMYMEIGSEEGKKRVQGIQSRYFKTVQRILKSTRPLIFS